MQFTIIALGVALAVLVMSLWWARARGAKREHLEARCRRDIQVLRRTSRSRNAARRSDDVWSAGAVADPAQSRAKKAVAWVAIGSVDGGCGGCGGCGCGG